MSSHRVFCAIRFVSRLKNCPRVNYCCINIYNSRMTVARFQTTFTPRRAIMYVPGHDMRKIQKIPFLNVDCVVLDLEDGVASSKKDEALKLVGEVSEDFNFGRSEFSVRVNSIDSGRLEKDMLSVLSGKKIPKTIMVPKVDSVRHVHLIVDCIQNYAKKLKLNNKIALILFIESATALLDLRDICSVAKGLSENSTVLSFEGLVFGSDDFCASIGATRTAEGFEILTARQMFVMIAKSYCLQAIDMVHIDYKDLDSLKQYSKQGAGMGFTGKQVIHPTQIPIVQEAFSPSQEKIEWATELVKLFDDHQKWGKGAFTFQGAMIDRPLLLQAQNIIEVAKVLNEK